MNIVFMGTPDFSVPCLQALLDAGYPVTGVFTQPDKPKGRGYQLAPPPVKEFALTQNLPVFQPKTMRDAETLEQLKGCNPDLIVVVAYGKLLPKEVLDLPRLGCINVHASLLPKYRGAGPVQWSIINGEEETGVTTMYMAEALDTGDMLESASLKIGENETADELMERLSHLGAELLISTVKKAEEGTLKPVPQDEALSTYVSMLDKEMARLDFNKPAREVHNLIRGLSSWPCAYTFYQGKRLKVYRSKLSPMSGQPGELLDAKRFIVACRDGAVEFETVQYEGGKRMPGADFLRGKKPGDHEILG
ncbi:MAG TPA: methionyl-tRNA formyltransferase [Candidatus Merdivicinus excrementipullorum]|uniref:Methionyl-tRNA formyltransferase n=1 Tax=Candidatus Merdivicinus excrementipullorum TaxID=2840867 RepID=A0A9D1FPU8_9FIRM|nr:methionyl-tRNA formyltransferase [Candidatus Merdivicinus excrementipullorum]